MERRFQSSDLESFVARALNAVGLPAADAKQVARLMILADLRGSDGHGISAWRNIFGASEPAG
jgi:LDH2 family malate/lactate/ureidoglycolate dehydrogenase